ncbi:MAG: hypothetical protein HZB13_00835 [Acidobacteria bacterium]|nr:hypothetical protein [Acidobacteriota bacterium]
MAKEIGRVASTLTDDMQSAALKKARDNGFDLRRGRLSLNETLINLSRIRDVLLDATDKRKLIHLPLKIQYTLYQQALQVSETLTSLVNGTDAVLALEDVVDELTSSAWQYNLHNLSEEVLGFQQKMNQLKNQEVLIREAYRKAQDFEPSSQRAGSLLQEIEGLLTNAKERGETIHTISEQASAALTKATEAERAATSLALQAEQHHAATARHEASALTASATAQTIADRLSQLGAEIETAKTRLEEQEIRISALLSTFENSSSTALTGFQTSAHELRNTTEAATQKLREEITRLAETQEASADKLLKDTAAKLETSQTGHDTALEANRAANNETARVTIEKLNSEFQAALKEQEAKYEDHRTQAKEEYDRLVSELDKLEGQIKGSILRATGFTLFHSFQKRQEDLVSSKKYWAKRLAYVVGISLALSIGFIFYVNFVKDFGPAFYLKLSVSLPIIYAIWFCSVQYSRERRLEEEYAFKSNISISLEPYRELVERLISKDQPEELAKYTTFIIESVGRVFTSPTDTAFDHSKDSSPAEGVIKAFGDVLQKVDKLRKQ